MADNVCDKYITIGLKDNDYLRGDDCKSSLYYLLGFIRSDFRRGENRSMTIEEEKYTMSKIDEFLKS